MNPNFILRNMHKTCASVFLTMILVIGLRVSAYSQTPTATPKNRLGAGKTNSAVKITQDHDLWWFNGAIPPVVNGHYNTTATLSVIGVSGSFQWQINAGSDKAVFLLNSINGNTIKIQSTQASGASSKVNKDIDIKVVQNGKTIATFKTVIYRPYRLGYIETKTDPDTTWGYLSKVRYKIYDQFGRLLPDAVPINEKFNNAGVPEFPGTNWRGGLGKTDEGGTMTASDTLWQDNIGGEALGYIPSTVSPAWATGAGTKVLRWTGTWQVGSLNIGQGCQVRATTWGGGTYCLWRKYRGYGHHE